MENRLRLYAILLVMIFLACVLDGCKKNETTSPNNPPPTTGTIATTLSGIVKDEFGNAVPGATLTAHGQTTISGDNGEFIFANLRVPASRCYVQCSKTGFFPASRGAMPDDSSGMTQVRIVMISNASTHTIDGGSGGQATLPNGTQVEIPSGSLVNQDGSPATGTVNLSVRYFDPSSATFASQIPGGDLASQGASGQQTLRSFGVLNVRLTGPTGNPVALGAGKQSSVTMKIPENLAASAPDTISVWSFNESNGLWVYDGTASKQGGMYVGSVSHFSAFNWDLAFYTVTIYGLVVDQNGNPVAGAIVVLGGQIIAVTGPDGRFCVSGPSTIRFTILVDPAVNYGISSAPIDVGPFNAGQEVDIGTLRVNNATRVTGALVCNGVPNPGAVYSEFAGGYNFVSSTANGHFDLAVPPNVAATLVAFQYGSSQRVQFNYTTPAANGQFDFGTINVCPTPFEVSIVTPTDGSTVQTNVINVSGTVSDTSVTSGTIITNGQAQPIGFIAGHFSASTVLNSGRNTIKVRAVSRAGSVATATVSVTFQGRAVALTANLVWNTDNTDMDLHMTNPNNEECYYGSRTIGGMFLDVDNTTGFGPENISVDSVIAGTYTVFIQNYRNTEPTTVTVKVYKGESIIDTKTHTFDATPPRTVWVVGTYGLPQSMAGYVAKSAKGYPILRQTNKK